MPVAIKKAERSALRAQGASGGGRPRPVPTSSADAGAQGRAKKHASAVPHGGPNNR